MYVSEINYTNSGQTPPGVQGDAALFAYALEWAKSGGLAKIHYDDNTTSLFATRETQYVIWHISRSEPIGWPDEHHDR